MADSKGKCFTGRITRLVHYLNRLDSLFEINLLGEKELINNICRLVYELLKEEKDPTRRDKATQKQREGQKQI